VFQRVRNTTNTPAREVTPMAPDPSADSEVLDAREISIGQA